MHIHYFITNTGQYAYVTTPLATLPSNNLLKPVVPLVQVQKILSKYNFYFHSLKSHYKEEEYKFS